VHPGRDERPRYGGADFEAAWRLVCRLRWPGSAPRGEWRSSPADLACLWRVVVGAPRLVVRPSPSPAGRELRGYLGRRLRRRLVQGVLVLPASREDYLRGRSRQAVRTALRRAAADGASCAVAVDVDVRRAAVRAVAGAVDGVAEWGDTLFARPFDRWWVARDAGGQPVGFAAVTVDGEAALLQSLVACSSEIRVLVHTEMVGDLCAAGVRCLAVRDGCALLMPSGLHYLQQRLGYELAHLRVAGPADVRDRAPMAP